jgi:hypothetical protein
MAKRAKKQSKKSSSASKSATTRTAASKAPAKSAAKTAPKSASKTASKSAAKTAGAKPTPEAVVTMSHDEIANRAYMIWLAKGKPAGQDAANWREAERELVGDR